MITVSITADMVEKATKRFDELPKKLNYSFANRESKIAGFIGEEACEITFGFLVRENTSDWDFRIRTTRETVDTKTKKRTVVPFGDYMGAVRYERKQKCDYYFFTSVLCDEGIFYECHIMGWMFTKKFYKKATFFKKGDIGKNGFIYKHDCWEIPYSLLKPFPKEKADENSKRNKMETEIRRPC
jgi:hypothetical protein